MRDKLWMLMLDTRFKSEYAKHYDIKTEHTNRFLTLTLIALSTLTIGLTLFTEGWLGILSAFVALASQVAQAFIPTLPFSKRSTALEYYRSEVADLVLEIEREWDNSQLKHYDDTQLLESFTKFRQRCNNLDKTFLKQLKLPECKKCKAKAEIDNDSYFKQYHGAKEGSYKDEQDHKTQQ